LFPNGSNAALVLWHQTRAVSNKGAVFSVARAEMEAT